MAENDTRSNNRMIADAIWEPYDSSAAVSIQNDQLKKFFNHCARQQSSLENSADQPSSVDSMDEIQPSSQASNMASVECAVRMMLMTECETEGTIAIGSRNVYRWGGSETLVDYLSRIYTQSTSSNVYKDPIDLKKLRCHVLTRDTVCRPRTKVLLVFSHKAFLEHSLEIVKVNRPDLSHTAHEALALGCLPPKLIDETLRTYNLLFPLIGSTESQKLWKGWVKRENLDPSLLKASTGLSKKGTPRTLHDLYEDFPYWAPQLARLLEEVDDPTPTTRWEKYAERRKSHRHTYKCAIAALVVAAVSGTLATLLAAVQVWISYCDWEKNTNKTLC
ncbi:hypothetical protein CNYM01_12111 [Colletotrichum nymphaeae SA-01]|uniref:Uncharacterized protein n=1 Tax=Colletotrichum nymphaeae SA-01 TaxID=1460502 RepID=A0A135SQB6_9PEZI|nr:hypothetical protein CNYM01_12111 [Colletotrichum nymphaeae SA-01]